MLNSPMNYLQSAQSENLETLEPGNRCYRPILKWTPGNSANLLVQSTFKSRKSWYLLFTDHSNRKNAPAQRVLCAHAHVSLSCFFFPLARLQVYGWCQTHPVKVFPAQFSDAHTDCFWKHPLGHSLKYTLIIFSRCLSIQSSWEPILTITACLLRACYFQRAKSGNYHAADINDHIFREWMHISLLSLAY